MIAKLIFMHQLCFADFKKENQPHTPEM